MRRTLALNAILAFIVFLSLFVSGCTSDSSEKEEADEKNKTEDVGKVEDTNETMPVGAETGKVMEDGTEEYSPVINPADFVDNINNPYFPLVPGTTFFYEGESEDETIRTEVFVTSETRVVMGVNTTVIRDREWEDDELVEETFDWYAQDKNGNIWYFGEESKDFEDGKLVSTEGSWEAGVNGAQPGILIEGKTQVGDIYRQEYLMGEAEDMAEVLALNESVSVEYGSFENCLKTKEWNPLEPGSEENKYYATGIGLLLEMETKGGSERLELVDITVQ
jgi:hypothetical protein